MGRLVDQIRAINAEIAESGNLSRRSFVTLLAIVGGGGGLLAYLASQDTRVKTTLLASSSGVELKKHLEKPEGSLLFPGLNLTIQAESGRTIDWQREQIDKKQWLADCSPFALVILNLGLNDLLNRRSAREIYLNDFVPAYDLVAARCDGKRISVLGAFPVARREGDWQWFVQNQRDFYNLASFYALSRGGLGIDPFAVLADSDGLIKNGLTNDGTHINLAGWEVLSPYATPQLLAFARG